MMKIGNIVRIKKNICDMDFYIHYMEPYCGKVATVVKNLEGFIKLDIDNEEWWWTEEMVEPIEDANAKDTLGSKIRNHLSPFYNALCAISMNVLIVRNYSNMKIRSVVELHIMEFFTT